MYGMPQSTAQFLHPRSLDNLAARQLTLGVFFGDERSICCSPQAKIIGSAPVYNFFCLFPCFTPYLISILLDMHSLPPEYESKQMREQKKEMRNQIDWLKVWNLFVCRHVYSGSREGIPITFLSA